MTFLNHDNNLCVVTLPSPSTSAESAKLQSKLEALKEVEKLCEFYENSKNVVNPSKNLLDNLCDGLETFLGFNSSSKGYDGSGIVYSDLDRLCDGVMGFLSGVLEAVKNENEVTTYDNKDTESNLSSVLEKLQSSIGSGRAGLAASVAEVKRWLEGYEGEVKKRTKMLTDDLNAFNNKLNGEFADKIKQTDNLQSQLSTWTSLLGIIETYVKSTENIQVGNLDSVLRNEVNKDLQPLKGAINVLKNGAENEKLKAQAIYVDKTLVSEKNKLDAIIKDDTYNLQQKLYNEFNKCHESITALDDKKKETFSHIRYAVQPGKKDANMLVNEFEAGYKNEIDGMFVLLKKALSEVEGPTNSKLRQEFNKIKQEAQKLGETLGIQNSMLANWKNKAENVVRTALTQVDAIVKKLNGEKNGMEQNDERKNIMSAATNLRLKAEKLMKTAAEAKKAVRQNVSAAKAAVITLDEGLKEDLRKIKDAIKKELEEYVAKLGTALDKGMQSASSWDNTTGFTAIMNTFKIKGGLEYDHEVGKKLSEVGISNPEFAKAIDRALANIRGTKTQWESRTPLPKDIGSAITKDIAAKIELLGEDDDANGVSRISLTKLTGYDGAGTSSKNEVNNTIGKIETDVNGNNHLGKVRSNEASPSVVEPAGDQSDTFYKDTFRSLHGQVRDSVNNLCQAVEQLAVKHTKNGSLKQKIDDLIQGLDNIEKWKTADGGDTVDGLAKIHETLKTLQSQISRLSNDHNATQEVEKIIESLEGLPQLVDLKQEEAKRKMEKLESIIREIYNHILTVEQVVTNVDDSVTRCIKAVQKALNEAASASTDAVNKLRNKFLQNVHTTFTLITNQIRAMFSTQHRADLSALRSLVDEQLKQVQGIIAKDRVTGVKGMLKRMYGHEGQNIKLLVDAVSKAAPKPPYTKQHFDQLLHPAKSYISLATAYGSKEIVRLYDLKSEDPDNNKYHKSLHGIFDKLKELLSHIEKDHHDHKFVDLLGQLDLLVSAFPADTLPDASKSVLAPLKAGLAAFTEQLGHAYVNSYSGVKMGKLVDQKTVPDDTKQPPNPQKTVDELTPEGRNCAKVCLTIVEILGHDLGELRKVCSSLKKFRRIYASTNEKHNALGDFFSSCGFIVAKDAGKQDGELRNHANASSIIIYERLNQECKLFTSGTYKNNAGKLQDLVEHIKRYYQVCHYATSDAKGQPRSVYEMLQWLSGLPNNAVHQKLAFDYFAELFDKPKTEENGGNADGDLTFENLEDRHLEAFPERITVGNLTTTLTDICAQSHSVLTTILGHGQAAGRYACDFNTNEAKLSYPSNTAACFDMLVDIVYRLYDQLYFLFIQCERTSDTNSWRDCWYGRYVGGSSWECNTWQCHNLECNQKANQRANQSADQKANQQCDQHPKCGLKSPLQSFLEDGLPGFLPHQFTKPGCKLECTVSKHRGVPCKTPMGFADISNAASHTKTGAEICAELRDFCGGAETPLGKMCSYFICILQRTPQTLGDMFAFYYNFIVGWNQSGTEHRSYAFNNAVTKAYFGKRYSELDVNSLLSVGTTSNHDKGNLMCLVDCNNRTQGRVTCGRYLQSFGFNTWRMFADKHAGNYLSWIVYLTETFYQLLKGLYDECCNNCNKPGTRCHGKICPDDCTVKAAYKSEDPKKSLNGKHHIKDCKSIATCPFTRPTLYKHGFTLKSLSNLSGINGDNTKRTCQDFCNELKIIVDKDSVLLQMFHKIDDFLLAIRFPFMTLTLALWLLSLLYLLHIMVIRLDLLHIKSHLHSPSSHRIAAQSLLAAARVNKLNRVFYLQP